MDMKRYVLVQVKADLPKTVKAGEIYEKYIERMLLKSYQSIRQLAS
ncbi:MAG: hypothetical protein ACLSDA_06635 [[Eubacterium] siraeum]